ncbi:MAG: hydrolase [Proteobacteria bacterium]|nr:hydrolase [Pseudomonadota bacterium]MBU0989019.1 hydrolase [Pseudomonadota bacterium]MBU1904928.1 hydrolase [Pseudomonadota bacterium]
MTISLLNRENTGLIIVDAQEKLMQVMGNPDRVTDRIVKLLHLSRLFNLPVVLTEQYSKWLGPTLSPIKEALPEYDPIEKLDFNCCSVDLFNTRLKANALDNIILVGVETHICVFQTCVSLLERGYRVHVPHHAVDSRTGDNWNIGLSLMKEAGAVITSTETVVFQILKQAGTKEFKEMLKVIK